MRKIAYNVLIVIAQVALCFSAKQCFAENPPFFEVQDLFESVRVPKIVVTTDGTVIAMASENWFRRSEDKGKTWSPIQPIGDGAGGNAIVDENTGDVMMVCLRRGYLWRSHDNGKTWEKEHIVMKPNVAGHGTPDKVPAWAGACESGITLRFGAHKGRLLMPARVCPPMGNEEQEWWSFFYNMAVYSDDGGKTWQTSKPVQCGTGESVLAELSNGDIYYNSRSHMSADHRRQIAWSYDGGDMYTDWEASDELFELARPHYFRYGHKPSYGCNAGLVRLPIEWDEGNDILLYSAPDSKGGPRVRMTVWASFDGAKTWPVKRLVYEGPSSYSSLAADKDGTIYLLFERGKKKFYEGISIARFNLEWLTEGQFERDWQKFYTEH